jgi:hypothetical protein
MTVIMTVERREFPPGLSDSIHLCNFCEKINALYSLRPMFRIGASLQRCRKLENQTPL